VNGCLLAKCTGENVFGRVVSPRPQDGGKVRSMTDGRLQLVMPSAVIDRTEGVASVGVHKLLTWRKRHGIPYRPRRWVAKWWTSFMVRTGRLEWWLVAKRGFGVTLWATIHEGVVNPFWPTCSWYGDLLMMKRRVQRQDAETPPHLAPIETEVLNRCIPLVAHCAATKYDDGAPRKPGWFTVRTRGSAWEIEIKDPDTCSRLVVIQGTLDDALALATMLLDSEEAPWEPDPWLAKMNAPRGKK